MDCWEHDKDKCDMFGWVKDKSKYNMEVSYVLVIFMFLVYLQAKCVYFIFCESFSQF
jgi:hypothetical protein